MAAHDYYNSFNGGTPQMMGALPAQPAQAAHYAPSSATAPPPYQEFNPHAPIQGQKPSQPPYNIADFKYNYDPNINYGPSTPPQQHAQIYRPAQPPRPQQQQQQVYHTQQPYASTANLRPPPPNMNISTTSLRPQRSSSEPPSPYYERKHSTSNRPHTNERRHHHSHSHSHSRRRSRSRSRDRERERERPRGKVVHKEKNTFLGAIGGSVVGDLIFPGLGTIGGAILGGLGGHEASKKKAERERERERNTGGSGSGRSRRRGRSSYEEEWEEGKRRRGEY